MKMTNSDLEEKLEIALNPFADRIKRAAATGQVLREFLYRIQRLENDEVEYNIVSPANMCRNCKGTSLTYNYDTAVYTCDCCKTRYARVLGKIVNGVRVHWLGVKIK